MIGNTQGHSRSDVRSNGLTASDEMRGEPWSRSAPTWLRKCQEAFSPNSEATAYTFVVFCVAIATCFRVAFGWMDPGKTLLFAPYYPTVLLVSLLCGMGPGILAVVLSLVVVWCAFVFPIYGLAMPPQKLMVGFAFFFAMASLIVWISQGYRTLLQSLREEQRDRLVLMKELQHRGRNSLMVVQAIVNHTLRGHWEDADKINDRINALAATDELITLSTDQLVDLKDVAGVELRPYGDARVSIQGSSVILGPTLARTMALVFHELATNAAKYGALSKPDGRIAVSWRSIGGTVRITWIESGGPPVAPPTRHGFGLDLVDSLVKSFDGLSKTEFRRSGVVHVISFALPKGEVRYTPSNLRKSDIVS
jgi:two-component sensor histidine kinase